MNGPKPDPPIRRDALPDSIAIAGAWGYIGRKFLDVALAHGLTTYVYDPGPAPEGLDLSGLTRVADEAEFARLNVELFHLAVHPEHRRLERLLARDRPVAILCEKPMAAPEHPEHCGQIVAAVEASAAVVLYDFPELFDPLTARVLDYLSRYRDLRITEFFVERSKDREDPSLPRNYKRMLPIQYQETVHCLAFVLYILAHVTGSVRLALDGGVGLKGHSNLYRPPNPEAYPEPVDGRCRFQARFGDVHVEGCTDFSRNAEWAKRRVIRGYGDGEPFEIEVSYLEGSKSLRIDGSEQPCDPAASSYLHVLATTKRWTRRHDRTVLMAGRFPNPRFTRVTYQLSSALWKSCRDEAGIAFDDLDHLLGWDTRSVPVPRAGRPGPR